MRQPLPSGEYEEIPKGGSAAPNHLLVKRRYVTTRGENSGALLPGRGGGTLRALRGLRDYGSGLRLRHDIVYAGEG